MVRFKDLSGQHIPSWHWEFGDGNTSGEQNPVHIYRHPGNYTVNLTVGSVSGNASSSIPDCVMVLAPALIPFPEQDNPPGDPDDDGYCEDLNGNGRTDFDDVVLYFCYIDWISENVTSNPFDYNQNERIDFDDLFCLFLEI
jgi:PKD repeat protein